MATRQRKQAGETLVEICIALVIIGVVVSAFFAAFSTAVTASTAHRNIVSADAVLRDYAEATKTAVRTSCDIGSTYDVSYTPPSGFTVNSLVAQPCPAPTAVQTVGLTVTMPNGHTKSLSIAVRTP